jgi:hypothetical protein
MQGLGERRGFVAQVLARNGRRRRRFVMDAVVCERLASATASRNRRRWSGLVGRSQPPGRELFLMPLPAIFPGCRGSARHRAPPCNRWRRWSRPACRCDPARRRRRIRRDAGGRGVAVAAALGDDVAAFHFELAGEESVLGLWPMAMNTPISATSSVAPVCTCLMRMPVTPVLSPSTSSSVWFHLMVTLPAFSFSNSLSCMIFSARNLSRRCTTVTWLAMLARYSASSTAVLPPPITATGWFL